MRGDVNWAFRCFAERALLTESFRLAVTLERYPIMRDGAGESRDTLEILDIEDIPGVMVRAAYALNRARTLADQARLIRRRRSEDLLTAIGKIREHGVARKIHLADTPLLTERKSDVLAELKLADVTLVALTMKKTSRLPLEVKAVLTRVNSSVTMAIAALARAQNDRIHQAQQCQDVTIRLEHVKSQMTKSGITP